MFFGPYYRQVAGGDFPLFRQWAMYGGYGNGIADPTFFIVNPDGTRTELDHFEILGYQAPLDTPRHIRRIDGHTGIYKLGNLLREKLPPDTDLRVTCRISSAGGWFLALDDQKIPPSPAPKQP